MTYLDFTSQLEGDPAYLALFSTFQFDPDFFERRRAEVLDVEKGTANRRLHGCHAVAGPRPG